MYLIMLSLDRDASEHCAKLQKLLGGPDVPNDKAETKAQDYQFEFFVASLVRLGGVLGVHAGEPDIRIQFGNQAIGIAAKRVSSRQQLIKRIRKAIDQTEAQRAERHIRAP
jgi:hypothetical protein